MKSIIGKMPQVCRRCKFCECRKPLGSKWPLEFVAVCPDCYYEKIEEPDDIV